MKWTPIIGPRASDSKIEGIVRQADTDGNSVVDAEYYYLQDARFSVKAVMNGGGSSAMLIRRMAKGRF